MDPQFYHDLDQRSIVTFRDDAGLMPPRAAVNHVKDHVGLGFAPVDYVHFHNLVELVGDVDGGLVGGFRALPCAANRALRDYSRDHLHDVFRDPYTFKESLHLVRSGMPPSAMEFA